MRAVAIDEVSGVEVVREVKFSVEPYSAALIAEMRPLWEMHDREIPQLGMALDPRLELYAGSEKAGSLRIFLARIAELLVGYQVFFVMYHPHRRYSLEANQDIIWMDPEVRRGLVGLKFIRWADEELEKEGVKAIHRQISAQKDFGHVLERIGYGLMDLTYAKVV